MPDLVVARHRRAAVMQEGRRSGTGGAAHEHLRELGHGPEVVNVPREPLTAVRASAE